MCDISDLLFLLETADSETLADVSHEIRRILLERGMESAEMPLRPTGFAGRVCRGSPLKVSSVGAHD